MRIPVRAALLGAGLPLVLCASAVHAVCAQEQPAATAAADDDAATSPRPMVVTGRLVDAARRPLPDAVVVTSAGGRAVSDAGGAFALEVEIPVGVERLHVTAFAASTGAGTLSASATVPVAPHGGAAPLGELTLSAGTDCEPQWLPGFGQPVGFNQTAYSMAVFDDGNGPALYVGGGFTTAGGVAAGRLARWDGRAWTPVGDAFAGTFPRVEALVVFDDGSGPALYAGGSFTSVGSLPASNIARWDGTAWSALGTGIDGIVSALVVYDDHTGPALYAAGSFHDAGGVSAHKIAKWDGTSWSGLGAGLGTDIYSAESLVVFDDGQGEALYAGGAFLGSGSPASRCVARWAAHWDGLMWSSAWEAVGDGLVGNAESLVVFDDGTGARLYAGGTFEDPGGQSMMVRLDGATWTYLALAPGGVSFDALLVHDDGGGPALFVGGAFSAIDGVTAHRIARYDGTTWSPVGGGIPGLNTDVWALATYDDGLGTKLFATGRFGDAGGVAAEHVASWDGTEWRGLGSGANLTVHAFAVHDDGGGPDLYAGGEFTEAGGALVNRVARWDGEIWTALGTGMDGPVYALAVYEQGGDELLCAGGAFATAGGVPAARLAAWDGNAWSPIGGGVNITASTDVRALLVWDDGGGADLYAGGEFASAGGVAASRIARWDGAAWSALGAGVAGVVEAMAVHDDGTGPALYAGGRFTTAGGTPANRIARWNGTAWSALGTGMSGGSQPFVFTLAVHDDGTGPALYAGGAFTMAGGITVNRIARWNGTAWSALGTGVSAIVEALVAFDDGAGEALYAGGSFATAGGGAANRIARWSGGTWSPLGAGVGPSGTSVMALLVHDDGAGAGTVLFAGGSHTTSGSLATQRFSKWDLCAVPPTPSAWTDLGLGHAGTGGLVPQLVGSGPLSGGSANALALSQALPGATSTLVVGLAALNAPFKGGTLVPHPTLLVPGLPVDGTGGMLLPFVWPTGLPAGLSLWFQSWIVDPGASAGLSASNGLRGETT